MRLSRLDVARVCAAAAVVVIGAATLVPVAPAIGWQPNQFGRCLFCGELGGLDAVNNILLYLPLGAALAAAGWRLRATASTAAGLAAATELVQFSGLTGRYAGFGDVFFNTLGATLGAVAFATRRHWTRPSPRMASAGAAIAAAGFVAAMAVTAWLLALSVPSAPLAGQWAPRRAVSFLGEIHGATLNGQPLRPDAIDPAAADEFRRLARGGRTNLDADATLPDRPPLGFAPIVRVVTDERVHLALGQSGHAIVFAAALNSREVGFRTISIGVAIPPDSTRLRISGRAERDALHVSAATPAGRSYSRTRDLTAGLAWTTMLPSGVPIGEWHWIVSAAWLLGLALPLGFYAVRSRSALVRFLVPGALGIGLIAVPAVAGLAATGWSEWAGAVTGAALGAVGRQRWRRARFVHRALPDTWTAELPGRTE